MKSDGGRPVYPKAPSRLRGRSLISLHMLQAPGLDKMASVSYSSPLRTEKQKGHLIGFHKKNKKKRMGRAD